MSDFKPGDKKYCTPMCVNVCDELRLTGLVIRANLLRLKKLEVRVVRRYLCLFIIIIIDEGISVF